MSTALDQGWLDCWAEEDLRGQLLLPLVRQVWFGIRERAEAMLPYIVDHRHPEYTFTTSDWIYPQPGMHLMASRYWFGPYSGLRMGYGFYRPADFPTAFMNILSNIDIDTGRDAYGVLSGYAPHAQDGYYRPYNSWRAVASDPEPGTAFDIAVFLIRAYRIINGLTNRMTGYDSIDWPDFVFRKPQ